MFVISQVWHPEYLLDENQEKIFTLQMDIKYWQDQLLVLRNDYATYCNIPENVLSAEHLAGKRNLEQSITETQEAVSFKIRELKEMRAKANLFLESSQTIKRSSSDLMEAGSNKKI